MTPPEFLTRDLTDLARKGVFDHGIFAFAEGRPRDDHPFKTTEEGARWIAVWQAGWDCAVLAMATAEGRSSRGIAGNPYPAGSAEAAAWLKGWRETNEFRVQKFLAENPSQKSRA